MKRETSNFDTILGLTIVFLGLGFVVAQVCVAIHFIIKFW